jgi:hypothetical protein
LTRRAKTAIFLPLMPVREEETQNDRQKIESFDFAESKV